MPSGLVKVFPQPLVAVIVSAIALIGLAGAWLILNQTAVLMAPVDAAMAIALGMAVVWAYLYSIHLSKSLKVEMTTVPLYLMAVLLPSAPLAATTAGLSLLTAELIVRARRRNYYSDVLTAASRGVIVALATTTVAHLEGLDLLTRLAAAVFTMWALDMLTAPLVIAPMSGERPLKVLVQVSRQAKLVEGVQYLLGLLGVLAANVEIWAMLLLAPPTVLVYLAFSRAKEIEKGALLILERMADAVDLRDPYTGGHSRRVAEYCAGLLRELKIDGTAATEIVAMARVHDIGKIGIPDNILLKGGDLSPDERRMIETHAEQGADLLSRYPDFARGVAIVRHHHENWDGSGYPHRLRGEEIPLGARIIAVADSFDAMTSDRPYHPALPIDRAAAILREGRGRQWDPNLVDAFLRAIEPRLAQAPAPKLRLISSENERRA